MASQLSQSRHQARTGTRFEHDTIRRKGVSTACRTNARCSSRSLNGVRATKLEYVKSALHGIRTKTKMSRGVAATACSGKPRHVFQTRPEATMPLGLAFAAPVVQPDVARVARNYAAKRSFPKNNGLGRIDSASSVLIKAGDNELRRPA